MENTTAESTHPEAAEKKPKDLTEEQARSLDHVLDAGLSDVSRLIRWAQGEKEGLGDEYGVVRTHPPIVRERERFGLPMYGEVKPKIFLNIAAKHLAMLAKQIRDLEKTLS